MWESTAEYVREAGVWCLIWETCCHIFKANPALYSYTIEYGSTLGRKGAYKMYWTCGTKAIYSAIIIAKKLGAWIQVWFLPNLYVTVLPAALIMSKVN